MSSTINIPQGSDVQLVSLPPNHLIIISPPGTRADPNVLTQPGLTGVFTHDPGLTWPDRDGVQWANQYLAIGSPVVLEFTRLADARTCHERLLRSAPSASAEAHR